MLVSRRIQIILGVILFAITQVLALQAKLAGVVDWHRTLIGVPLFEPTPPSFVDTPAGKRVVAITRSNVLACLNATSGGIVWRHLLEADDPVVSYHVKNDAILLLSGPSATTARLFNLTTGYAIWERALQPSETAHLTNPVHLGTDVSFSAEFTPAVVILSGGKRVSKLRLSDGYEEWAMNAPGIGDTILFKNLMVSDQAVHILAITRSFESLTLTTLTLDLLTSRPLDDFAQIPCLLAAPEDAHLMGSDIPGSVRVVWLEVGRIRTTYIGPGGYLGNSKDLLPKSGRYFDKILATQTKDTGLVLGMAQGGEITVLDLREGGRPMTIWDGTGQSDGKSPSVYSSARTETGVVFSRIYWSFPNSWSVIEALSVSFEGDIVQSGYTYAFDTAEHGVILDAAVSPMLPFEQISIKTEFMPTLMITTSSGALQLVHGQGIGWQREESLADIAATRFVDLGEPEVEDTRNLLAEESFLGRTSRHLLELRNLPAYLFRFAHRLTTSSYSSAQRTSPLRLGKLHRDQFGLQKLLVVATRSGKLFAIDSANGNIVWRRNLGITTEKGSELAVKGMWNVRGVDEGDGALLAVLATRTHEDITSTVGFHVEALTGLVRGDIHPQTGLPTGKTIIEGESHSPFLIPFENCGTKIKVLAVVDEEQKIHIFPKCKKVASDLFVMSSDMFCTTRSATLDGPVITGHSPSSKLDDFTLSTTPLWTRQPILGETLLSITPVIFDNIASFGRPLGNKGVLYKYLNPHLVVLASAHTEKGYGKVEVLDSTSGRVVYTAMVDIIGGQIKTAMVENWVVFAWKGEEGWRITSVELYEDVKGKGQTPGSSSFGSNHDIITEERTFFLGFGVKALDFTTSKFGITAKELLVVNDRNQISSIPRRLLDPRRPKGKPTSADKEEMLLPYDSVIGHEPKRVISHKYQVLGAEHLATSPTLAESTSLLFAYGLDLFLTRGLTPSGTFDILSDSFNKVQILLSLAVLSGGIAVARPAVRRKTLKMRWY